MSEQQYRAVELTCPDGHLMFGYVVSPEVYASLGGDDTRAIDAFEFLISGLLDGEGAELRRRTGNASLPDSIRGFCQICDAPINTCFIKLATMKGQYGSIEEAHRAYMRHVAAAFAKNVQGVLDKLDSLEKRFTKRREN